MTILDKLLEKKDVLAYIKFRIEILELELSKVLIETEDKDKQQIKEQFNGRILELKELKKTIEFGFLKLKSISNSRQIEKIKLNEKLRLKYE